MYMVNKLSLSTGTRVAGIPLIPREIRANRDRCCGNPAVIEFVLYRNPAGTL